MSQQLPENESYLSEMRLLLEELSCDLCRFEHFIRDGLSPENVHIDREFYLGVCGAYADIRVMPKDLPPYFVEIKYGYSDESLLSHLKRKYGQETAPTAGVSKVILVVDKEGRGNWPALAAELPRCLRPGLALELWDEARLGDMMHQHFRVRIRAITPENLLEVRQAIDRSKGFHAFGGKSLEEYCYDPLHFKLLWHFSAWRLRQLREIVQLNPRQILPPGLYRGVAVVLADLCSFSSFVRDTPSTGIIRESLTSFYSKARYQIINSGGMLYQFVGDEVIGIFGIPDRQPGFIRAALDTARALISIGNSVTNNWQRRIDREQASGGLHIGMAIGDLQIVSLRPFGRSDMGAIGDCINVAARLMSVAVSGEIVATNSFVQELDEESQAGFREIEPVEARNVGRIKAWKLGVPELR